MSYDEGLAERIRELVEKVPDVTEKNSSAVSALWSPTTCAVAL